MIYPLVKFFQYKLRFKSRIISIFCALFSITIIGIAIFTFLVPPMLAEIGRMNDLLVTYLTNGAYRSGTVPPTLSEFIHRHIDLQALNRILSEENIMNTIKETVLNFGHSLRNLLIFCLAYSLHSSFYYMWYSSCSTMNPSQKDGFTCYQAIPYLASNLVNDIQDGMNRYFRGQALVAFCVGILFSIGFLIDFPMAIALGLFIGALNMVPYLQIIGFLPTVILAILKAADTGENFWSNPGRCPRCFYCCSSHPRWFPCPKNHGKDHRLNPAIILYLFHLGILARDVRYDQHSAHHPNALLLSTFHHQ